MRMELIDRGPRSTQPGRRRLDKVGASHRAPARLREPRFRTLHEAIAPARYQYTADRPETAHLALRTIGRIG